MKVSISTMLFSVIIPVYNTEKYLSECVDSVLNQSYKDYEIILINDGSKDRSRGICDAYANCNGKIKVIHQENGGLSKARNTGIQAAKGDYLIFLDSDDILLDEDALSEFSICIDKYKPDVLMYLPKEYNEDFSSVVAEHTPYAWNSGNIDDSTTLVNDIYRNEHIYVTMASTKVIRREYCIENNLLFTPSIYHEDDEWVARLLLHEPKIAFCPHAFYGYRHRENSIISTVSPEKIIKKVNDRINISIKILSMDKIKKYPCMVDYFLNYYIGSYVKMNSLGEISGCHIIPFNLFLKSKHIKFKILGIVKKVFGYKIAKKILDKHLKL